MRIYLTFWPNHSLLRGHAPRSVRLLRLRINGAAAIFIKDVANLRKNSFKRMISP